MMPDAEKKLAELTAGRYLCNCDARDMPGRNHLSMCGSVLGVGDAVKLAREFAAWALRMIEERAEELRNEHCDVLLEDIRALAREIGGKP